MCVMEDGPAGANRILAPGDGNAKEFSSRCVGPPVPHESLDSKNALHHVQTFVPCSEVERMSHADTKCGILVVSYLAGKILVKLGLQGLHMVTGEVRASHGCGD